MHSGLLFFPAALGASALQPQPFPHDHELVRRRSPPSASDKNKDGQLDASELFQEPPRKRRK